MDSITQFALGAACGEAIAGKKLGNRAMWWGGLAGTIPDFDIITNVFYPDVPAMMLHRGITHSFLFTAVVPLLLSWLAIHYYRLDIHQKKEVKWALWAISGILILAVAMAVVVISFQLGLITGFLVLVTLLILITFGFIKPKLRFQIPPGEPSFVRWYLLFFAGFLTHIMLDAFTPYGTQLLQPFSDARFAFDTIAVVDPGYTMPLIIGILGASFFGRSSRIRRLFNWAGILFSSLYLLITIYNHNAVMDKWQAHLEREDFNTEKVKVTPTIFNNILWHGVARKDSVVMESYYSFYDDIPPFSQSVEYPVNNELIEDCENAGDVMDLKKFSDGFYIIDKRYNEISFIDMRYGSTWSGENTSEPQFVFRFIKGDNCRFYSSRDRPDDTRKLLQNLMTRIKGLSSDAGVGDR